MMMRVMKLPKRLHQIHPIEKAETDKEILDRYKLISLPKNISVLDISKLPSKDSPEYNRLMSQQNMHQIFSNTIVNILIRMDDLLESILADCWEGFKPFIPPKIFRTMFKKRYGQENTIAAIKSNPLFNISEMGVIGAILTDSVTHLRSAPLRDKVFQIADSLTVPIKIVTLRAKRLKLVKKEIRLCYKRFVTRYPTSQSASMELLKDFNRSGCHVLDTISSPFNRKPTNSVYFCFDNRSGYSVLAKSITHETGLEWKERTELTSELQRTIAQGIGNEAEDRVSNVLLLLKGSVNRIHQSVQSPSEEDQTCLTLELVRLKKLFKFQKFSLPKPGTATILFSLMRILSKINILERILLKCSKHLKKSQKVFLRTKTQFHKLCPKAKDGVKRSMLLYLMTFTNWGEEATKVTGNDLTIKEPLLKLWERGDGDIEEGQENENSVSKESKLLESDEDDTEINDDDWMSHAD